MGITLRSLEDADLDQLHAWESDPRAVAMAAFTRADPADRSSFDAHYARNRNDPDVTMRAVDDDHGLAGMIASFTVAGDRELTYWVDPARWGRGVASAALAAFLQVEPLRPLFARVAEHNVGSAAVLVRAGFVHVDSEVSHAAGLGRDVVEHVYRLDA
ncbi:putative acetyltransferase [Modestobacter italicus]|uniref:Acetyltransferase n=1 Tax=Modestobacter italicus (strain DSM 44449 / CECT 9708 / BC 501) TaxID=2732864 RepID=I4EVQ0_MODI5|nr:GNAT family N-acetyltransferase [Modestobacter marinus]CCH87463.1 putative acetyltransferase [Modestobacter marinus]